MAIIKNLLKKHDAFETDLNVHKDRINHLNGQANELKNDENTHYKTQISDLISLLNKEIESLEQNSNTRKANLLYNSTGKPT